MKSLKIIQFSFVFAALMFCMNSAVAEEAENSVEENKKKSGNPVIDAPVETLRVLYGGFQGFGSAFDGFVTGDKAPEGSMDGKQDPLPITSFEDRYNELQQMDYGVGSTSDFAQTDTEN
ncbi:MAG: hypothetical protein HY586_07250 [Candidatus Omnitrophica bacterium]|nr:hypothetical protein [Candidatus Omnitrophota bacterium]